MSKMNEPLRIGVIGTGAIAREEHLPYWRELEQEGRVKVAAVCDIVEARAQAEAQKSTGARAYTDYRTMLKEAKLDIVDVCTQNRFHAPNTIDSLDAGAHVIVEKPMAMNVKQCEQMIAAANRNKRKLMVAQHMRFEAPHEKLKSLVERGELGSVYTAQTWWLRRRGIPGWGKFHIKQESLGGPLIDIGVHMIDLTMWLMGNPKPVAATGKVYRMFGNRPDLFNAEWGVPYQIQEFDVEDYAIAMIRFENEMTMQVSVSWAANIPEETAGLTVLGDKAGITTHPLGIYTADENSLISKRFDYLPKKEGHRGEIRHFVECLEQDLPVRVQPVESLNVQKIIDAIYASSEKNREVIIK